MEIQDVYDVQGNLLGKTCERYAKNPPGEYVKVVHVFLVNANGECLIQQRALCKFIWPGQWAILGGYVRAGESSEQTVVREVAEEVGGDVQAAPRQLVYRIVREEYGVIMEYWMVQTDLRVEDCVLQPDEVAAVQYVDFDELHDIYAHSDRWTEKDAPYIQPVLQLFRDMPNVWKKAAHAGISMA